MKFWRSSKRSIGLVQEKKNKKSSSYMKTFFQFFAKGNFLAPKQKFLPPPIQSPQTSVVEKPVQTLILVEEKTDDLCTASTAKPQISKKSHSIVAKLMGLDLPAPPQRTPKLVLNPSEFSSPKTANNTSQIIQDKHCQPLPPILKDESNLVQSETTKAAASSLVQNSASLASEISHTNQQKTEQTDKELYSVRPVKSPPRSASPASNDKILQATARLLDIGSQTIKSGGLELQDPVIEKFGSKLNHALTDCDGLKTTTSSTDNKAMMNEQVTVGRKEISTKRDVFLKNAASAAEIKKDAQKGLYSRDAQGNISTKMPPRTNKMKQNHVPVNNAQKDFIALNRSMIKSTPLRTKNKGLEKKQETKNSVKKVRQIDFNNRNGDAKSRKVQGANVKRGDKGMIISKGVGLVSEKPRDFKSNAQKEEDMCIVSFTFSAPMNHSNRYTSGSDSEGRTDSGLTESSISSSVLLDDGTSYNDAHVISTSAIHQGPSLYDELASGRSNGLSDTKLDADNVETSLEQTEDENLRKEAKFSPTDTIDKTSDKRSSEISRRVRSIKSRQHKTSYGSTKIELLMQNLINSKNSEDQISSFLSETTESVLKALSKVPNSCKEVDQLKEIITDFVTEHLYMVQSRLLNCGYNSWQNLKVFCTKEKIQREIEKEIVELQRSVGKKLEVLIGKDMENWMDSRVKFEIGIQIEKEIISQLIGEVVRDFLT